MSMHSIEAFHIVIVFLWWTYYIRRMFNHAHDDQFLKHPWLTLWLSAYFVGLAHTLNSYYVQSTLEATLFEFTDVPLIAIIKLALFVFIPYFNMRLMRPYIGDRRLKVVGLLITAGFMISTTVLLLLRSEAYEVVFWSGNIAIVICSLPIGLGSSATLGLFDKTDDLSLVHLLWYGVFHIFAMLALLASAFSGLIALSSNGSEIYTMPQIVSYLLGAVSLFGLAMMTSPDTIIYRTSFPIKLWRYFRLRRLTRAIVLELGLSLPTQNSLHIERIDETLHQEVIWIMDALPYLSSDSQLRQQIEHVMKEQLSATELITSLTDVKTDS